METHHLHPSEIAEQHAWSRMHGLTTTEDVEHREQDTVHRGHTPLLTRLHHAQFFQTHTTLIQQPGVTPFMHVFHVFPRIQGYLVLPFCCGSV
jgi:hypothetical protein